MADRCKFCVDVFACFFMLCLFPTPLTASPELLSDSYGQIAQQLGLKFPIPRFSYNFGNISTSCNNSLYALISNRQYMQLFLDALGKPQSGLLAGNVGWLGSYSECTKMVVGAHYCLAYLQIPAINFTKLFPISWGICAPQQCNEQDITYLLEKKLFPAIKKSPANLTIELKRLPLEGRTEAKPVYCKKKPEYTTGVIMTLTLCGLILSLCLVGTIIDILLSFTKPHSLPVNKSDGFMPIRGISMATDNEQAPHVPIGKTNADSDSSHLVHSSPEVIFSASSSMTSFPQPTMKPNLVVRFFLCFSFIQNTNRIMDTKVPSGAITSINGMRVLSMWWVILGHVYSTQLGAPVSNLLLFVTILQRFTFETIGNATFSVDSFFFLSGFLVAYLSLRYMEKKNGELPLFNYYFHRFWRLTPTYMFVLLFYDKLTVFLGEGPIWLNYQSDAACDKYWWTNLLYINNFYPTKFGGSCMAWGWYLANDMQFYIIAPAILFMAYR